MLIDKDTVLQKIGLRELENGKLAIFCGAGISKDSGLPLANDFKKTLFQKLNIDDKDITSVINSKIPLELIIGKLAIDADSLLYLNIFQKGQPNTNHIIIAKLAKYGYVNTIVTTNFDLLIERALENEGLTENKDYKRYFKENDFDEINGDDSKELIKLIKLHGTIDDLPSIRSTIDQVTNQYLSEKRVNALEYIFSSAKHNKVLILGYSCSDVFDISPYIENLTDKKKEIIYINHSNNKDISIEEIKNKVNDNPFSNYTGYCLNCKTQNFVELFWNAKKDLIGDYSYRSSTIKWKREIDEWLKRYSNRPGLKYFFSAIIYTLIPEYEKGISFFHKALKANLKNKNKLLKNQLDAGYLYNIGNCYRELGDYATAIEYVGQVLNLAIDNNNKLLSSKCCLSIGSMYHQIEHYQEAIDWHEKALKTALEINDKMWLASCYEALGSENIFLKNYEKVDEYFGKTMELIKSTGDKSYENRFLMNYGTYQLQTKRYQEAIKSFKKGLDYAKKIGNKTQEAICYNNIANAFYYCKDYENSLSYFNQAENITKELNKSSDVERIRKNIEVIRQKISEEKKNV